jgi:CheY-like chemotaxis protein
MAASLPLEGVKVLVAEDNFLVAEYLSLMIERAGGTVIATEGDVDRLSKLVQLAPFDCAVLDIQLANGKCFEAASQLKQQHRPFVFVSGYDSSTLPVELRGFPFLQKPIGGDDLVSALLHS